MKFYPISELTREHQGRVVLVNVRELALCVGQIARPWGADEREGVIGTEDPEWLKLVFSHFLLLSEIEAEERSEHIRRYGPLSLSEEELFAEKYARSISHESTAVTDEDLRREYSRDLAERGNAWLSPAWDKQVLAAIDRACAETRS